MSAKNANNNAENAKNGKAAKNMTEHYTLGHKAVAVAMSTVMLGFGVPVNAPKDAYADSDSAAEQQADSDSSAAKKSTEDSSAKKLESSAATDSSAAKSDSSSSSKASNADSSSAKEAAKAAEKTTADVALSLGNASIKYKGQTIAAPTTKVTVPTKSAFKFTVAADNGYTLTKVTLASPVTSRVAKKLPATMIPMRSSPIARPKSPMLRSCSSLATSLSACWPTPVLQSPVPRRSLRQTPLRLRTTVRVPRSSGTVAMAYSPNGRKAPITAH